MNAIHLGRFEGDGARRARVARANRDAMAAIDRQFRIVSGALLICLAVGAAIGLGSMTGLTPWLAAAAECAP